MTRFIPFIAIACAFIMAACRSESTQPTPIDDGGILDIAGVWRLDESTGGIAGNTIHWSDSTARVYEIDADGLYTFYDDGYYVEKNNYRIFMAESALTGDSVRMLQMGSSNNAPKFEIVSVNATTLVMNDPYVDGYTHTYRKAERPQPVEPENIRNMITGRWLLRETVGWSHTIYDTTWPGGIDSTRPSRSMSNSKVTLTFDTDGSYRYLHAGRPDRSGSYTISTWKSAYRDTLLHHITFSNTFISKLTADTLFLTPDGTETDTDSYLFTRME